MSLIVERGAWRSSGKGSTRKGPAQQKPLSRHAIEELRNIAQAPEPRCGVNPGVSQKLEAEGLVDCVRLPSPFAIHKGDKIEHLQITDRGRRFLERQK